MENDNDISPPIDEVPLAPYPQESVHETEVVTAHRRAFNKQAFTLNPDLTVDQVPTNTSKRLTPQKWKEICDVLRDWGPTENGQFLEVKEIQDEDLRKQVAAHRKTHKKKYKWAEKYRLQFYIDVHTQQKRERLLRVSPMYSEGRCLHEQVSLQWQLRCQSV